MRFSFFAYLAVAFALGAILCLIVVLVGEDDTPKPAFGDWFWRLAVLAFLSHISDYLESHS